MVYAMLEADSGFESEMDRRVKELENGSVKGYTLDVSETRARTAYNASKK
jgi:hypothetical protein